MWGTSCPPRGLNPGCILVQNWAPLCVLWCIFHVMCLSPKLCSTFFLYLGLFSYSSGQNRRSSIFFHQSGLLCSQYVYENVHFAGCVYILYSLFFFSSLEYLSFMFMQFWSSVVIFTAYFTEMSEFVKVSRTCSAKFWACPVEWYFEPHIAKLTNV